MKILSQWIWNWNSTLRNYKGKRQI